MMQNKKLVSVLAGPVLALSTTMAQAILIYDADNEGFSLGTTPPTTGPLDAPTSIDPNLGLTVEDGTTVAGPNLGPDKFLRLTESAGEAPDFRYDAGVTYTSGEWLVSMDLLFENLENYHVYFRESSTSAVSVANINFIQDGRVRVESSGGISLDSYAAGVSYELLVYLDLGSSLMDVFLNSMQIANDLAIDDEFGAVLIGYEFSSLDPQDPVFNGVMQVDNFRISSVPEPSVVSLVCMGLVGMSFARKRMMAA